LWGHPLEKNLLPKLTSSRLASDWEWVLALWHAFLEELFGGSRMNDVIAQVSFSAWMLLVG